MLLDGVNHIAWLSKDVARLGRFYTDAFDAEVGPTRPHGPGETMTNIRIGPHLGSVHSILFRDPDGLEGEVLLPTSAG